MHSWVLLNQHFDFDGVSLCPYRMHNFVLFSQRPRRAIAVWYFLASHCLSIVNLCLVAGLHHVVE